MNRCTGWHECIRYVINTYSLISHRLIHTSLYTVYFFIFLQSWGDCERRRPEPEPTTRVGLAPDTAWGVGAIQRARGSPWDWKQYSSLPHSTPDNTALVTREQQPLGRVSDQKIVRQISWEEYFVQTGSALSSIVFSDQLNGSAVLSNCCCWSVWWGTEHAHRSSRRASKQNVCVCVCVCVCPRDGLPVTRRWLHLKLHQKITVEIQKHISNNTCPFCVTVHKTHL